MAPSRKSRSLNKRFSYFNEVPSNKNGENTSKSRQRKRKLRDMLGPQWSKDELERFYKAYRKHANDWQKVATVVRSRSAEMVEALYTMNKAYLSLPKGYASSAGLIAMMTDHYSNLGDSDSEQEINEDTEASRKPQKRARESKGLNESSVPDIWHSHSAASNNGCLSLLKKRRSGSRPWAVGKRTPRIPVSYSCDADNGEKYISPNRQCLKIKVGALDYDVAHEIALALTEASQKGGSPQVSQTPTRKTPSTVRNGEHMHTESEMTNAKLRGNEMDEGGCELSLGSSEVDVRDRARDNVFLKGKRYHRRKPEVEESIDNHLDDIKEACSGTEEGQKLGAAKGKFEKESANTKLARSSSKGPKKRSKKVLFGEDEDTALDALQALADLSLRLPEAPVDTESSVHNEEEKGGIVAKSKLKGNQSTPGLKVTSFNTTKHGKVIQNDVSAIPEAKKGADQSNNGMRKRRQKSFPYQISENEERTDSHLDKSQNVEATGDVNNLVIRDKSSHDTVFPKQRKLMKPLEHTSSSTDHGRELNDSALSTMQVLSANQFNLPTKMRSRRKINTPHSLTEKDIESSEKIEKLSNCLSSYQVQRWCVFEWFYSAIDYPWFAKREFVEYLDHVGLGHIPRLTRVEWGVIRSSLGKPRRFSEQFLKEEKEKLDQYRESVRKHYTELRAGNKDGLPTDLARLLSVGQRVIALHPKTREIHDGSVLTVDHSRRHVQFDQPELGVEFVMDIDCMPANPSENMPAAFMRHTVAYSKFIENLSELKIKGQPVGRKMEEYVIQDNANGLPRTSTPNYHISNSLQQDKVGLAVSNAQTNVGSSESVDAQRAANAQPSILAHIQAKDADIQALSELTRALDKKEAVVSELKCMNDEASENQKDGENSLRDLESFKKHYAAVLIQLNDVNEQVSSALFCLRQRNTYQMDTPHTWMKSMANMDEPVGHCSSFDYSADDNQESGSHVAEIVESSRTRAETMVKAAVQAISSLKEGSSIQSIEEAIDFVNNQLSVDDLSKSNTRTCAPASSSHSTQASQDQLNSCTTNLGAINHAPGTKLNNSNEAQIPSELIARCVATLLMIQKCTERQFPPCDVAQVLDYAVTSLKPCCSQNLPIYAEVQKCLGIIRNQILALIPT